MRDDQAGPRYVVSYQSESSHCCFQATVLDTRRNHSVYSEDPFPVCECFDPDEADDIAAALNLREESNA